MDSLLAGKLPPFQGRLACHCDVQRRWACQKHSGHRESHSGFGRKQFAFPPESLFAFSPESCSRSPRNPFRLAPESALLSGLNIADERRVPNHGFLQTIVWV
jgi:hypothetical protein